MSSDGSDRSQLGKASGLTGSTPLVTVSAVHGTGIRPAGGGLVAPSPVGSNHPLAAELTAAMAPPAAPAPQSKPTSASTTSPQRPPVAVMANPHSPTLPVVASTPVSTVAPNTPVIATVQGVAVPTTPPPKSSTPLRTKPSSPVKKSLDALADSFLSGPSYRQTELQLEPLLKPPLLPPNETGIARLRTLVERRAWGDVLQISGDMLRSASSPHAPVYNALIHNNDPIDAPDTALQQETVEILTLECHAWLKLRRYTDLGRELERWEFSRINDVTAVAPTWVPWSLHILAAESLQYTDGSDANRCTDELFALRQVLLDKKDQNEWVLRVDHALVNTFVRQKDWRMALVTLDHMLDQLNSVADVNLATGYRVEILSRQGRIFLQAGGIEEARILMNRAKEAATTIGNSSNYWIVQRVPCQVAMNEGMLCFANAEYEKAMVAFKECIDAQRRLRLPGEAKYCRDNFLGHFWVDTHGAVLTQGWNNMALSALYTCRMREAVRMMEALVREDPTAYLTERLAFNLCTLYELGSDTAASARKKRVLQLVAKRFYLHDIGPESFRLS